jgi:hypothetical protein
MSLNVTISERISAYISVYNTKIGMQKVECINLIFVYVHNINLLGLSNLSRVGSIKMYLVLYLVLVALESGRH